MFIPSLFKTVQARTFLGTGGNVDDTLPIAVNPANTVIIFGGCASTDASGFPCGTGSGYLTLLNSTIVRGFMYGGFGTFNYTAIEFYSGFMRTPVQYGISGFFGGALSVGTTIAAVGPKAFILYLGMAENIPIQADMASVTGKVNLFNPTTVLGERYGGGGVNAPDNAIAGFCVVDPK